MSADAGAMLREWAVPRADSEPYAPIAQAALTVLDALAAVADESERRRMALAARGTALLRAEAALAEARRALGKACDEWEAWMEDAYESREAPRDDDWRALKECRAALASLPGEPPTPWYEGLDDDDLAVLAEDHAGEPPRGLLAEDHSEIREVPAGVRDVWTKQKPTGYTREQYEADKARRVPGEPPPPSEPRENFTRGLGRDSQMPTMGGWPSGSGGEAK